MKPLECQIYIECLATRSTEGHHGEWLDITDMDRDDIESVILHFIRCSPTEGAEEWAVTDTDNLGEDMEGNPSPDTLAERVANVQEHGQPFLAFIAVCPGDPEKFEDTYCGEHESELAYAEEMFNSRYTVPEGAAPYIDYDAFRRDIFLEHFSTPCEGGDVHVFSTSQ